MTGVSVPANINSTLPPDQVQKIRRSAQEFEAMAVGQLLTPIFDTVDNSTGPFGGGPGEAAWKPMMVAELAKGIAKRGSFGLTGPIMEQMLRMQEAAHAGQSGAGE